MTKLETVSTRWTVTRIATKTVSWCCWWMAQCAWPRNVKLSSNTVQWSRRGCERENVMMLWQPWEDKLLWCKHSQPRNARTGALMGHHPALGYHTGGSRSKLTVHLQHILIKIIDPVLCFVKRHKTVFQSINWEIQNGSFYPFAAPLPSLPPASIASDFSFPLPFPFPFPFLLIFPLPFLFLFSFFFLFFSCLRYLAMVKTRMTTLSLHIVCWWPYHHRLSRGKRLRRWRKSLTLLHGKAQSCGQQWYDDAQRPSSGYCSELSRRQWCRSVAQLAMGMRAGCRRRCNHCWKDDLVDTMKQLRPTLAKPTLAILVWPTLAKPILAKPTLAKRIWPTLAKIWVADFGQTDFGQF